MLGKNITIRDYLYKLLTSLWVNAAEFSGKRPFGNGNWKFGIYKELIVSGFIPGTLDEDGYIGEAWYKKADKFVQEMIKAVFYGVTCEV